MNRLIPYFVLLSAGAHALALATLAGSPATTRYAGQNLSVTLLAGPSQVSRSVDNGATGIASDGKNARAANPEATERQLVANGAKREEFTDPNKIISGVKAVQAQASTPVHGKSLLTELNKLLSANFVYPPIARKLGQQGRVIVTVNLGGQGQIENTELFESSGYRVLDQAALRSIRDIRHAPHLAKWLNGRPTRIRVPVIYRLAEA